MVYLHENREEFTNAVNLASEYFHILPIIAEKAPEALENFGLEPFEMKVQGLDRTLATVQKFCS